MKDNDEVRNYINNNEDFKFKYYDLYSIIIILKKKLKRQNWRMIFLTNLINSIKLLLKRTLMKIDNISELLVILKENHGINLSDIIYIVIINLNNKDIVKEGCITIN
ncbi:hypothetical protein LY90DRAFT_519336 [Neocallimastix californiae]|uniref:Uncharacterized protein n=1 Tax=Neocallimastix californiae TaxID=1754190 RepID=A0A1Y1Z558_9FUNG|nr:hypothetical protein LY90DRAFT_519336 [Neocallimastix californiae]|eukprot:ORY05401.1 hypothetical protein LY90DRAFT_519336 [Neocallimastix californiae]